MGILKRAILYVSRKWQQSLIVLLVLLAVCTSTLIGFSVLEASRSAAVNLRRQLGGTFCMEVETGNPAYRKNAGFSQEGYSASYAHLAPVHGWSSLEQCSYFANHLLEVTQGVPFTDEGAGQAVISRELAELNHIEIGDMLTLEVNREVIGFDIPAREWVFEVVGLFEICGQQQVNQFTLPRQMLQNWVFVDSRTLLPLISELGKALGAPTGYDKVRFSVNDPAEMDAVIRRLRENREINWDCFKITMENTEYENAEKALKSMDGGIKTMILAITAAGIGVLALLCGIWAKFRIQETGILLSLGKSRWGILAQRITEAILISALAFGISWALGSTAADGIGNRLLAQANEQNRQQTDSPQEPRIPVNSSDLEPVFSAPEVEELTVDISAGILTAVCGLELVMVLLSVCAAGIPVMRMEPKAILTKHE